MVAVGALVRDSTVLREPLLVEIADAVKLRRPPSITTEAEHQEAIVPPAVILRPAQVLSLVTVAVSTAFGVDRNALLGKGKVGEDLTLARQVMIYLLHTLFKLSFLQVGTLTGRNERIVADIWEKIDGLRAVNLALKQDLHGLEWALGQVSSRAVIVEEASPPPVEEKQEQPAAESVQYSEPSPEPRVQAVSVEAEPMVDKKEPSSSLEHRKPPCKKPAPKNGGDIAAKTAELLSGSLTVAFATTLRVGRRKK